MRTLVDLPKPLIEDLAGLSKVTGQSRAALIREAVKTFVDAKKTAPTAAAFGLWAAGEDGLSLQNRLREEW